MDGSHPVSVASRTISLRAGKYLIKQKYMQLGGGLFKQVIGKVLA
jgi:hypothetical protein